MPNIVYVLTNPAMPGIVKIGKTDQDIQARMKQLFRTNVPLPFECAVAVEVEGLEAEKVEKALFEAFRPHRVHGSREFFAIEPSQVKAILELFKAEVKEITAQVQQEAERGADTADREAVKSFKRARLPNYNFAEMGIPVGATLVLADKGEESITAIVAGEKKVVFQGEEMGLTKATKLALDLHYSVAPCPRWTCEGRNLGDIYRETYRTEQRESDEDDA